jgi:anti-sigma regulatory factor (Ser/Thr protein kinase)
VASTPGVSEELELSAAARPEALQSMRHALGDWLADAGAASDEAGDVALAVGEALANAVEHAYEEGEDGAVALVARREDDGVVAVAVRDFGRGDWRRPAAGPGRGCGIGLMQALMDSVEVTWSPKGTEVVLRRRLGRAGGRTPGGWARGEPHARPRAPGH